MIHQYSILGHANAALAILLDSLYSHYGEKVSVEIISNIKPEANDFNALTFRHPAIQLIEHFYTEWQPSGKSPYLLGAMSPKTKKIIHDFFLNQFGIEDTDYATVVHKSTVICNGVELGVGGNISPLVTVAPFAELGQFVTLNRNVSIGHHTVLEDFVSINPGCHIAGLCRLGEGVQVGVGATILDQVEIGAHSIIGAGTLVTKNVPPKTLVWGSPAKIVKSLD